MTKWSSVLKNIISISVAECSVILVGCRIWGWKKKELRVLRKLLVSWCESNLSRSKLKSPITVLFLFLWCVILSSAIFYTKYRKYKYIKTDSAQHITTRTEQSQQFTFMYIYMWSPNQLWPNLRIWPKLSNAPSKSGECKFKGPV